MRSFSISSLIPLVITGGLLSGMTPNLVVMGCDSSLSRGSGVLDPTLEECIRLLALPPNPPVKPFTLDVTRKVKEGILATLAENAKNNAWMEGYTSQQKLLSELKAEGKELLELGAFFQIFEKEFDEAVHADPYIALPFIQDHVQGFAPDARYRNADFTYELKKIRWQQNKAEGFLLKIQLHAHPFYYFFTETPELILKDTSKRWAYLPDVDFKKTGTVFSDTRYNSPVEILQNQWQDGETTYALNIGFAKYTFATPEKSFFNRKHLVERVKLHNALLSDPD